MKKCVIVTTVNPPGAAVRAFARTDFDLIVAGDRKTPRDYEDLDCVFLDLDTQRDLFPELHRRLPLDHYARKNMGYAWAVAQGYDLIAESDDDNVPLAGWGAVPARFPRIVVASEYPNCYRLYTNEHIWPRGFPLDRIGMEERIVVKEEEARNVFVVQGLVNGEPDVDAVFRLCARGLARGFTFSEHGNHALQAGVLSPFNSQNTFWTDRRAFPWLYLPATVSDRYTDILRSWIAQFGIWASGGRLGFAEASVFQDRNPHDLLDDFRQEIPMHLDFYKVMDVLGGLHSSGESGDPYRVYNALHDHGVVAREELAIVAEWLRILSMADSRTENP